MNDLFLALFLLSFIALIIGLIKPSVIRQASRKKVAMIFGGGTILFLILFGATTPSRPQTASDQTQAPTATAVVTAKPNSTAAPVSNLRPTTTPVTPQAPNETVSQKNAVKAAQSYLSYTAFSRNGLVAQLEYEKFSQSDAVYGADNSGADWNKQAAKAAKQYMSYSAFSRGSLITQLEYDKFTQAQAEYGANSVGL